MRNENKHCKSAKLPSHHNFVFFGLGQEVSESGQNHSLSSYSNVAVIECIPIAITAGNNQTKEDSSRALAARGGRQKK